MSSSQQSFLDLLPLLVHTNHPLMPGYTEHDVPHGVSEYRPSKAALRAASKVARSFSVRPPAGRSIQALFIMGSAGTIAQSVSSDLDIWICHRPDLREPDLAKLNEKCESIARWADRLDLEVHFFLMSAESFRESGAGRLSNESSGTAQHHLLLDEFYRSAILVAGCAPLWWVVPADVEHAYDRYAATLLKGRFIKPSEYLDFGSVAGISAAEFLGAALWQLAKAITAPHKSLLKILLLEAYAADYPRIDLLSLRFKRAVHTGEVELGALDPYLLLHDKVQEYLRAVGDQDRLELCRRCLYYKLDLTLSRPAGRVDWRHDAASELAREWGWRDSDLAILDNRRSWKIDRTLGERQALVGALTRSYKRLSAFAREHTDEAMVSQRDMTILGRKLFAAFEQKAGKIEQVNLGIADDLSERHLTLQPVSQPGGQPFWLLHRGHLSAADPNGPSVVRRGWSALELIAWSHFNALLAPATRITVCGDSRLQSRDLELVKEHLRRHVPARLASAPTFEAFAALPGLRTAALYVNLDSPTSRTRHRNGALLTTTRVDALSFSGWRDNLVQSIDYLVITTWGEILTSRYHGLDGLMACLCEHLRWVAASSGGDRHASSVSCCAPRHAATICTRLSSLFEQVVDWSAAPGVPTRRYIIRGTDRYYVLQSSDTGVVHEFGGTFGELLEHLGAPNPLPASVTFDRFALDDPLMSRVFELNRAGRVQFFYQAIGNQARVIVLDEHGALFRDQPALHTEDALLAQFARFFDSIRLRQDSSPLAGDVTAPDASAPDDARLTSWRDAFDFYRIEETTPRNYVVERIDYVWPSQARGYFDVKVIGEVIDGDTIFTLYCERREFSTREFGQRVFERVVEHILSRRRQAAPYPVYITDIDLSRLPVAGNAEGRLTIHYLQYKKRIERQMNRALAERIPSGDPTVARAANSPLVALRPAPPPSRA